MLERIKFSVFKSGSFNFFVSEHIVVKQLPLRQNIGLWFGGSPHLGLFGFFESMANQGWKSLATVNYLAEVTRVSLADLRTCVYSMRYYNLINLLQVLFQDTLFAWLTGAMASSFCFGQWSSFFYWNPLVALKSFSACSGLECFLDKSPSPLEGLQAAETCRSLRSDILALLSGLEHKAIKLAQ